MTKLTWGTVGKRTYEAGADRAVLYLPGLAGVAWNGLRAVRENPSGGEAQPYYYDGFKYLNVAAAEDFQATIDAFSAPEEFAACDGTGDVANGLFVTHQPRATFGFSYRTLIGDDINGLDGGYKIHIVYNALASPPSRDYASLSSSVNPVALSWQVTTHHPRFSGYRPTAHFIIDSRKTPEYLMKQLEAMLYGTPTTDPTLPTAQDLVDLFENLATIELMTLISAGVFAPVKHPVVMSPTQPFAEPGDQVLWLDTSAGDYSKLRIVTGV